MTLCSSLKVVSQMLVFLEYNIVLRGHFSQFMYFYAPRVVFQHLWKELKFKSVETYF